MAFASEAADYEVWQGAWRRVGSGQPRRDVFLVPGAERRGRGCGKATAGLARSRNAVAIRRMAKSLHQQYAIVPCFAPGQRINYGRSSRVLGLRPPFWDHA
jgi:hypothetical protein